MDSVSVEALRRARTVIIAYITTRAAVTKGKHFQSEMEGVLLAAEPRVVRNRHEATAMVTFFYASVKGGNPATLSSYTRLDYWDNHVWLLDHRNAEGRGLQAPMAAAFRQRLGLAEGRQLGGNSFQFNAIYANVWRLGKTGSGLSAGGTVCHYDLLVDEAEARDPARVAALCGFTFGFDIAGLPTTAEDIGSSDATGGSHAVAVVAELPGSPSQGGGLLLVLRG